MRQDAAMVIQPKQTVHNFETFIALPENADRLFELIDGEIVEKVPTEEHAILAALLSGEIYLYLKQHPIGRVGVEPRHKLPDDEHNARMPDIAFTRRERALPVAKSGAVPQMPDLAIEIQSPDDSALKMREKALYYLTNGGQLVWLLFPRKQQIEVHTADEIRTLGIDDTLDGGEVLPDFTLALSVIFAEPV
jgi:Uma2 family endonuclease